MTVAALSLVTFLHMALGEQAPKSLAIRAPKVLVLLTAPPLVILSYVFSPVIWLLNKASNLTLWVLGLGQTSTAELAHSEEELRLIVAESVAGGHLSRNERMMIENVLNLEEKTARRVMVPRPDIVYLSLARPLEDNLRLARQAGHTRFPLCEDDLSTVIGMIHVKDIFRSGAYQNGRTELRQLARKIPFLPVTLAARPALARISAQPGSPRHAAGRVRQRRRHGRPSKTCSKSWWARSRMNSIARRRRSRRWATMSSRSTPRARSTSWPRPAAWRSPRPTPRRPADWSSTCSGRLAKPGDSVTINGYRLTVLRADPTRIRKIRLEPYHPRGDVEYVD